MISYLREGWVRKSLVVKQEPSGWKLCLWTSTCQSQNMARDEWSSQLEVDCFDGGRWCRQRSIYACKYGCKICDEFFWDRNIHQQNCIQQSTRETDNVASGPKDSYLLEGNWIASDKIPECLQSRQSARTGFAIKDHNTIRSRERLQWTERINNTNSVLTSFFISLHPRWIFLQTSVRTVGKGVVVDWHWGGVVAMSVGGALRGDGNGRRRFHGDTWCASKNNENMSVGLMGIAG